MSVPARSAFTLGSPVMPVTVGLTRAPMWGRGGDTTSVTFLMVAQKRKEIPLPNVSYSILHHFRKSWPKEFAEVLIGRP